MNEKFYCVTEQSPLYKDYHDFRKNFKEVAAFANTFKKAHGIEAAYCSFETNLFSVVATDKDKTNFKTQFCTTPTYYNGVGKLYDFKKNSVIGRAWTKELKIAGLTVISRPMILLYFPDPCGKWSWNMFEFRDNLYLKTNTEREQKECPVGMTELKGSEFYKIEEEYDAQGND